jgi:hypothetical protein
LEGPSLGVFGRCGVGFWLGVEECAQSHLSLEVFLINFRQGNVKLALLKEFKPIILDFVSKNYLFCECRKFIANI